LPPTPAQVDAFVTDRSPDAWERLIDSLLASPHYGERYGRHVARRRALRRFAGFEYDMHRPNAWRYRDYVIKSFNDDKPYDRLPRRADRRRRDGRQTDDSLVADRIPAHGPARAVSVRKTTRSGRYDYLDEIIGTIGKGTLGLTVNCARCHHHKFDPISQKDLLRDRSRRCSATSKPEVPLAPPAEGRGLPRERNARSTRDRRLKHAIERREPYRDAAARAIKQRFPDHVVRVRQARSDGRRRTLLAARC
jgi:hypothetical protein